MVNKIKTAGFLILLLLAFFAGGWFFRQMPNTQAPKGEVEELYQADGEPLGIFDHVSEEDFAAAQKVASEALGLERLGLAPQPMQEEQEPASRFALSDLSDIVGVAPKPTEGAMGPVEQEKPALSLDLTGDEVVAVGAQKPVSNDEAAPQDSQISLIEAPVKNFLIKNTEQYKAFKTRARGGYPDVNFDKQMLVVLESDSNLPDNMFEIVSAETKDGNLLVKYRVNVLGLDKKVNTHTVLAVDKTEMPIVLEQVL